MKKIPSIKELKEICKKRNETAWRDKLNRSITIRFTKVFLHLGATPDQITILSLIIGLISVAFFATGSYGFAILAVIFHHLSHILDGCDGEIARYDPKKKSGKGAYMDLMVYFILFPLILMAMGAGAFFNNPLPIPNYIFLIAGFTGSYFLFLSNLITPVKLQYHVKERDFKALKDVNKEYKQKKSEFESQIRFFISPGEIFNIVFVFGILNLVWLIVIIYAIWYPILFIRKIYNVTKQMDKK